jgi:hypothetical protein
MGLKNKGEQKLDNRSQHLACDRNKTRSKSKGIPFEAFPKLSEVLGEDKLRFGRQSGMDLSPGLSA